MDYHGLPSEQELRLLGMKDSNVVARLRFRRILNIGLAALLCLAVLVTVACGSDPTPAPTPEPTAAPTATPAPPTATPEPAVEPPTATPQPQTGAEGDSDEGGHEGQDSDGDSNGHHSGGDSDDPEAHSNGDSDGDGSSSGQSSIIFVRRQDGLGLGQ